MSGSAVLPPKRPPRSPLKLQLPGTAPAPPAEPNGGRPKLSLNPAPPPNPNGRPSLKLPGLTAGLAGLSLAIPQQGVSRYSSGLDRGNLNDDDDELESDSDGDGSAGHGLWAAGEQERMAGELLEVINGAPAGELEDELSGRTRRPRSNSRFVPRRPSFNNSGTTQADSAQGNGAGSAHLLSPPVLNTVTVPAAPPPTPPPRAPPPPPSAPQLNFYGDHVRAALQSTSSLHSQASTPLDTPRRPASPVPLASSRRPSHDSHGFGVAEPVESDDDHFDDERDGKLDISPQTIKDLGRLGEGASGEVRKVLHIPSQIIMAKKTITTSPNPKVHKQHLRELLFMRDCTHPNIVQYYGAYLESNNTEIGICMEFAEAGSLERLYKKVQQKGYRTGEKVLGKIAESILEGLVYLHSQKIIHRDIKPSNVLVTRDGLIKLCDFGVSGELVDSLAGTFVGTTYYLSPERIRGGQYSINSDVWSMAVTVLEVALNRFPFPDPGEAPLNGPIELLTYLMKMDKIELPDDPAVGIKYTNAFRNFIQVCLDKDPATRPGPQALLSHGWIRRSRERQPPADLASWVRGLDAA
ncbi:putative Mitogen-activated protein kinase kinase [Rhodotorula taiwanensis]|uniref:Putative Mitogen-activated protein kinase kinase n=1 Tax=Rhodotorula taiwanensis TaxID=741276 RepID=A0A2S5BCK8_9BASI|nr:putative Mitogen-activated protein kinase kinase [Rhodotorula taiwanensis]